MRTSNTQALAENHSSKPSTELYSGLQEIADARKDIAGTVKSVLIGMLDLKTGDIDPGTTLQELGADQEGEVEIIMVLEAELGMLIPDSAFNQYSGQPSSLKVSQLIETISVICQKATI